MTTPSTTIFGSGHSFAIQIGGRTVAYATSHGNAVTRARSIEARATITPRQCLCCGANFNAAHKHNRLCRHCKDAA